MAKRALLALLLLLAPMVPKAQEDPPFRCTLDECTIKPYVLDALLLQALKINPPCQYRS